MRAEYIQMIDDARQEILNIRTWINQDKNQLDSKSKYLIAYCVVRASGTIEVTYKNIIFDYLTTGAQSETVVYLEKMILESSSNPNTGNISNLLQSVSVPWKDLFDQGVKEDNIKSDVNSLVQLRNDFAHGKNINISIDTVLRYFESATKMLYILDNIVKER